MEELPLFSTKTSMISPDHLSDPLEALRRQATAFSPPADRPDGQWIFSGQLDFLLFMADHETFALTQRVLHRLQTDLDLQHVPTVRQGKSQDGVLLRCATWPE